MLISDKCRQKGLQYAFEGYIQDVNVTRKEINKIKIEAVAYRSQGKTEPPHHLAIETEDNNIKEQHCSCKAGYISLYSLLQSLKSKSIMHS